jgi:hypothetical protein
MDWHEEQLLQDMCADDGIALDSVPEISPTDFIGIGSQFDGTSH